MNATKTQNTLTNQEYYQQRYDTVASRWDHMIARLGYNTIYNEMFTRLKQQSWLSIHNDDYRALDVGIGSGALSLALVATLNHPVHITGIDISSAMLDEAQANMRSVGIQPDLYQECIEQTTLRNETHNMVMSAHVLEHFTDPTPALEKMVSLLKPDGTLLTLITKSSLLGQFIQFKWGVHPTNYDNLVQMLSEVGLSYISSIELKPTRFGMRGSIAMIAKKSPSPSQQVTDEVVDTTIYTVLNPNLL
ncbi:MAG: class I SAM-dependent methyltransferase [Chloroflexota bacterium]